jgi:hypothetical protein
LISQNQLQTTTGLWSSLVRSLQCTKGDLPTFLCGPENGPLNETVRFLTFQPRTVRKRFASSTKDVVAARCVRCAFWHRWRVQKLVRARPRLGPYL